MMASEKEKIERAFKTMKSLGIATNVVKPVLKRLLNLYDDNWKLIEEDNYRVLADAIFDATEDKLKSEENGGTKKVVVEPPLKKSRGELPEKKCSPKVKDGNYTLSSEEGELVRSAIKMRTEDSSLSLPPDQTAHCITTKKAGLIDASRNSDNQKKINGSASAYNHQNMFQTTHDIAASACGQAKISITCNRTAGQHNFHHPNANEVLSLIDSKLKQFYRNFGAPFCLMKLLDELCESYLKGGADSVTKYLIGNYPLHSSRINKESTSTSHRGDVEKRVSSASGTSISLGQSSVQLQPSTLRNEKRVGNKVDDISNGTEKVKISLLDEIGDEDLPCFVYSPENIVYQSAYVHISLARIPDDDCCSGCNGNCLSSPIPCACARDTGGDFAYTTDGLLKDSFLKSCIKMKLDSESNHLVYCQDCPLERAKNAKKPEKCKGHPLRKFIKECWRKCGCNMQCGNRVVQRGITRKLQVFFTGKGKGWGVRTLEKLPAGAFICEYAGEILTNIELYERNNKRNGKDKHVYPVLLDADWATEAFLQDEDALCLDATYYGNIARFMNHRCFDGTAIEIPVQVETPDRHYYHLAFFTKREVDALEELTWDYGIDFDDHDHPIEAFQCRCGSQYCRGRKARK